MFPCEMARYIAGFSPEARKSGPFIARWIANLGRHPRRLGGPGGSSLSGCAASKSRPNLNLTINKSGYNLAKMAFAIVLAPEAVEDLKRLKANVRADIRA